MSTSERFDLVVVGGGAAGEKGAAQAAYFGKRVAVVERRSDPGGATVHTGTLPSKTLREAALFLSGYRQRDLYGVSVEVDPDLEVAKLVARKNAVRELETDRMLGNLARHRVELVHGEGRLVDASTVEVMNDAGERRRLAADVILLVTGSSPFRPPGIPFEDPDVHDSDDILEIDRRPASLAVLGGGVVGCEYASMFAALGTDVHLVERREPLLPFLDAEIVDRMAAGMRDLGVTFHFGERAETVERRGGGLVCTMPSGSSIAAEKVLVTAGRVGNTAGLGLDRARRGDGRSRPDPGGRGVPHVRSGRVRGRRRDRVAGARVHLDGAGARRRVPRVRVRLQAGGVRPAAVRGVHDPRGELRRPVRARRDGPRRRRRRRPRDVPRQRPRRDHRRPRRHDEAGVRPRDATPDRLSLRRRTRLRAGARRPRRDDAPGYGRDLHRDGLQLPVAQRDLQVRGVRRAGEARSCWTRRLSR